jgi:hypothetical protein
MFTRRISFRVDSVSIPCRFRVEGDLGVGEQEAEVRHPGLTRLSRTSRSLRHQRLSHLVPAAVLYYNAHYPTRIAARSSAVSIWSLQRLK